MKKITITLTIIFNIIAVILLIIATYMYLNPKKDFLVYEFEYSICEEVEQLSNLEDIIKDKIRMDFESIYLCNSSMISIDEEGKIRRLFIDGYYYENQIRKEIELQFTGDSYCLLVFNDNINENIIGRKMIGYINMVKEYSSNVSTGGYQMFFGDEIMTNIKPGYLGDTYFLDNGKFTILNEEKKGEFIMLDIVYKEKLDKVYSLN